MAKRETKQIVFRFYCLACGKKDSGSSERQTLHVDRGWHLDHEANPLSDAAVPLNHPGYCPSCWAERFSPVKFPKPNEWPATGFMVDLDRSIVRVAVEGGSFYLRLSGERPLIGSFATPEAALQAFELSEPLVSLLFYSTNGHLTVEDICTFEPPSNKE